MADLDLSVGIDTAAAEEGLRRLSVTFHREIRAIDNSKAEAKIGADTTKLDKKIAEAKRDLLELQKQKADPNVDLDTKQFDAEVQAVKMRLKELGQKKTEIRVESQQLRDANRAMALSAKRQEAMAKQTERLNRQRERSTESHKREVLSLTREGAELAKLETAYSKLSREKSRLDKEGTFTFGGWPGRTKDEELALRKVSTELDHVGSRIKLLGGDLSDLDRKDRFGSKLLSWFNGLKKTRLNLGVASVNAGAFGKALAVLGPLVLSLTGGLSALVGVLGAGIVGASAVGAAALSGFALTMGGVALASKDMVGHLKEQIKAAADYRDAVLKYGKDSEQAGKKLEQLQNITKGISPDALKAVKGFASLREEWDKLTKPSRKPFFSIAEQSLKTIKSLMPTIANQTNKTFGVLGKSIDPILKQLRGSGAKNVIVELMSNFRDALPAVIRGLANIGKAFGNISAEASKFLPEVAGGFEKWSASFAHDTGTEQFKMRLDTMIHQAGDLLHLFHVMGQAIVLFFGQGAQAGDNMTKHLSHTIEGWNDWMRSIEGQESLHSFFAQSQTDTENFFSALAPLLRTFTELARALQPVTGGMLAFARAVAEITTELARIPGMSNLLKAFGVVAGAAFAYSKVKKFSIAIREAAVALGLMKAAEVGAAEAAVGLGAAEAGAGAAAGGAATGAGAAGLFGGGAIAAKLSAGARKAGLVAGAIFAGGFIAETGAKIIEGITGGQILEKGHNVWEQAFGSFNTEGVKATEEAALKRHAIEDKNNKAILAGYRKLRSGAIASLGDIGKIMRENSRVIANALPRGSEEARRKTAENFRAAADAIKQSMNNGTISVRDGTKRMRELLRNANLLEGRDPLGLAKGFADSWRQAGGINKRNANHIIEELRKMPARAREEAFQMMLAYGRGLVRGKKIPESDLRLFKSHALTELTGISGGFHSLSGSIYEALANIGMNLSSALKNMGVGKPPHFNLQKLLNMLPQLPPVQQGGGQQQGGFTVPGSGSGDKKRRVLPEGSFVMNREASRAYGLNGGGSVLTALEPKEHVFLPPEVRQIGPRNLAAMNDAVPRKKGGPVGDIPLPILGGPAGSVKQVGDTAIKKAHDAASALFKKEKAKLAAAGGGPGGAPRGPAGTTSYKGVVMATWVAEALRFAAAHGSGDPQPTSGYRSHGQNVSEGRNYTSEHEFTQYPRGAVDFGGMIDPPSLPLKMAVVNASRSFKYPLLAPIGFRDDGHASGTGHMLGGLVQALLGGGTVKNVGSILMRNGLDVESASGILGNAWRESHWDPGAVGTGGGGLWGFTTSPISLADMKAYAASQNVPWTNEQAQTQFMLHHLPTSMRSSLNSIGSVEATTKFFMDEWEKPGIPALAERVEGAQKAYNILKGSGGAAGVGGVGKGPKAMPKSVTATYNSYRVTPGGDFFGVEHKDVPVPLELPDFGPIPEDEGAVKKQMNELEHEMLPKYRAAYKQTKRKDVKKKLAEDVKAIEARIRELRKKLRELRYAKARLRSKKKHEKQLAKITGFEPLIEAARTDYERKSQDAEQYVALEPEERGNVTAEWVANTFEPYIKGVEEPAYTAVLGSENTWRNVILTAQDAAERITKGWEIQIGYPSDKRKPELENPDLHFPPKPKNGEPTALASWIYGLHDQIERIKAFANSHGPAWWQDHPNARKQRDIELDQVKNYFRPKLENAKFNRKDLTGVLGEGRESFNWFRGTGGFEDSMVEVQGLHWPDQHTKLDALPPFPVPGQFGGAIWDTQNTIRELGLKIESAKEGVEPGEKSAADRAGELQAFSDAIRSLLEGRPFVSLNMSSAMEPFMGAFGRGGVAVVGEHGPELAHMPSGTRVHNAEETARMLEPEVVVDIARLSRLGFGPRDPRADGGTGKVYHVTNNFDAPPPDPHTWARNQEFELGTLA